MAGSNTPAAANRAGSKPQEAAAKAEKEAKAPKAPAVPAYREATDFQDNLKAAKSAVKDNPEAKQALALITHLSWKTPGGVVGWSKGTTADVVSFSDDIAAPAGTPLPDAMNAALGVAEKATAGDKDQKAAVAALARVIRGHKG